MKNPLDVTPVNVRSRNRMNLAKRRLDDQIKRESKRAAEYLMRITGIRLNSRPLATAFSTTED